MLQRKKQGFVHIIQLQNKKNTLPKDTQKQKAVRQIIKLRLNKKDTPKGHLKTKKNLADNKTTTK